jgi:hypothetical protein
MVGPDGCLLGAMNGPADWAGADAKAHGGRAEGDLKAPSICGPQMLRRAL